ncbi:MAG: GntR family transcriptional regulator [Xanthomonadales bacterium]|jgi:DNA-binding GntR family transcriptional regulator|nr:GntR family transcriptional regulator [Xanthomonadales bacterium]
MNRVATARRTRTQAEQAFDELENLLVTLELPPGSAVQEKQLIEATGYGRTPVREAVQRLASLGLLRVFPRKGLVVASVDPVELAQILEVRRVLERLMVVKAAERASYDQRRALNALAVHLDGLSDDLALFMRLDRRLDQLMLSASGNPYLKSALAPMHAHCRRLWYMNLPQVDLSSAATFHAALARSVTDGDGAGAIRALNGIITLLEALVADLAPRS